MKKAWRWIVPAIALVLVIAAAGFLYPQLAVRYAPDRGEKSASAAQTAVPEESAAPLESAEPDTGADLAPDFTVVNAEGSPVSLSDFAGKPVVVNFWATWCPPCRAELPGFDSLYAEYGDRVEFLMVDMTDVANDTVTGVKEFVAENGFSFPVYYDTEFSAADAYAINAIPVTIFVRADGTLAAQQIGSMQESQLRAYLDELLKG